MKRKYHIFITLACCIAMCLTSCRTVDTADDEITTAEQAVKASDYELARSICESFTTDSTSTLGVNALCRLSIVYMKLSDINNPDINTAAATQCYQSAMRTDSDSAMAFYNSLPIDEARHVEIMSQLDRILRGSRNIYIDEDSISIELINALEEMEEQP